MKSGSSILSALLTLCCLSACSGGTYYWVNSDGLGIEAEHIHFEAREGQAFVERAEHHFAPGDTIRLTIPVKSLKTSQGKGRVKARVRLMRNGDPVSSQPSGPAPVDAETRTIDGELYADAPLIFTLPDDQKGKFELQVELEDVAEPEHQVTYKTDFRLD